MVECDELICNIPDWFPHSAEEDNSFDSKIASLCQSIKTDNNKHVCVYGRTYA